MGLTDGIQARHQPAKAMGHKLLSMPSGAAAVGEDRLAFGVVPTKQHVKPKAMTKLAVTVRMTRDGWAFLMGRTRFTSQISRNVTSLMDLGFTGVLLDAAHYPHYAIPFTVATAACNHLPTAGHQR